MNISIIIPNHSDLRISRMIDSIDFHSNEYHQVELVIVLNKPTDAVVKLVNQIKERKFYSFWSVPLL